MSALLLKRFHELVSQMDGVVSTRNTYHSSIGGGDSDNIDEEVYLEWSVKVKNLIVKICGEDSQNFKALIKADESTSWSGSYTKFKRVRAVFLATKEDFEGGYLSTYKSIVQAEVLDTELEQAYELLNTGYFPAAAVISGVVLETTLRELCDRSGIAHGKLDKMNADLTKAGVYMKNTQKQITAYAGIRNSAAHGNKNEFTKDDVMEMTKAIERFLERYLNEHA